MRRPIIKKPSFNIFEHDLVPLHEKLSKVEVEEVLRHYSVQPHQLPYIKATDPAVTAIGAKAGEVVRIRRKSPTAGESIFYRLVIE